MIDPISFANDLLVSRLSHHKTQIRLTMLTLFAKKYLLPTLLLWSLGVKAQHTVVRYAEVALSFTPDKSTAAQLASDPVMSEPIEVLSPKETPMAQAGAGIRVYTGEVKLRHKGTLLFCDRAIFNVADNWIDAIGHVLIVQGDTITVKADTLAYDGNSRRASLHGRVTFQDRRIVMTSPQLDYNLTSCLAHYWNKGRLVDSRNVLTSQEGYYDTRSRTIEVQQAVRLASADNLLTSYVLIYSVVNRMATLVQPARITGKDGVVVAQRGQYDTQSGQIQENAIGEKLKYAGADVPLGYVASDLTVTKKSLMLLAKADKPTAPKSQPVMAKELTLARKEPEKIAAKPDATRVAVVPAEKKQPIVAKPVKQTDEKLAGPGLTKPAMAVQRRVVVVSQSVTPVEPETAPVIVAAVKPVAAPETNPVVAPPVLTAQEAVKSVAINSIAMVPPVLAELPREAIVAAPAPLKKPEMAAVQPVAASVKPAATPVTVVPVEKAVDQRPTAVAVQQEKPSVPIIPPVAATQPTRMVSVTSRGPGLPVRPVVSTVAQAAVDVDESDLERTLNRKKRSH